MSLQFFLVGGIIFAIYIYFTIWNIIYSSKKNKEENYPNIPSIGFTSPAQAMPDMYKGSDVVEAYRQYYFFDKNYIFSWKKRGEPEWVDEIRKMFERE